MTMFRAVRALLLAVLLLTPAFVLTGCFSEPPPPATSEESVESGAFNQFFPASEDDLDLTFTQDRTGFAEAVLTRDGTDVASLSVSDTANNPDALTKFETASDEIAGYPAASVGSQGTAILVADRYQVQVRSLDDSFTAADRAAWIEKFDLAGLSEVEPS